MHGNLTIKSSDAGSVFRCEFVWQAVSVENNADNQAKQKAIVPQLLQSTSAVKLEGKILIADNDKGSVRILEKNLKDIVTKCHGVLSAEEAVKEFKGENYDIVFIDLNMDVLGDGCGAISKIRQHEVDKKLPPSAIFVLTGDDSEEAKDFLFKL